MDFAAFLGRSPDRAEPEDLRRYQSHLASLGASYSRMNLASTALRFFFHTTLGPPGFGDRMARIPTPERLPVVLSPEEVALLLAHAPSLKYRAALSVAYGCGLRISEIVNLKITDIDSARMLIRVQQGIRRFLLHVLPDGFHRIRHYGLFASGCRAANVARIQSLLAPASASNDAEPSRHSTPERRHRPVPAAEDGS